MKYFIVDAFADRVFAGNQAGVCLVDRPLEQETMQQIAAENNLAETAFVTAKGDEYDLRWFTPEKEIDLCGHATLASAFILSNYVDPSREVMRFHTLSGILTVTKRDSLLEMNFPTRKPVPVPIPALMEEAMGIPILEAHSSRDILLLVENEAAVKEATPNIALLSKIPDCFGAVITARGSEVDFVSRYFAPSVGVAEDSVTGSSHSTLIPFWSERLQKNKMVARQLSKRGGTLYCEHCGERVTISGHAVLYLTGEIEL